MPPTEEAVKTKPSQLPVTVRYATPALKMEAGKPIIWCPFCNPSHPLSLSTPSACGTLLEVRATQAVYKARLNKGMVCIKCKKEDGNMVQFNDAFVHVPDCTPDIILFNDPTKFSRLAKFVFHAPAWLQKIAKRYVGNARRVDLVTPDGAATGRTSGYYFHQKA